MNKVFWFAAIVLLIDIIDVALSDAPAPITHGQSQSATQHEKTHSWGYTGETGPDAWGDISKTCENGKQQSPIDIVSAHPSQLEEIEWDYEPKFQNIVHNGHTIQVNLQPGSEIEVNDTDYQLKQFHFHTPSENHLNGKSYPLEAHFVHADKKGNLAVVGVFFEHGPANPALTALWQQMPTQAGTKQSLKKAKLNLNELLPADRGYYSFKGSLTTPPCSEGVQWLVMQQAITASPEQIAAFKAVLPSHNNRPIQAQNQRKISVSK
ncbi:MULTISPECIES: carbonic anhydrase family protein [unclassified Motilimonas]|uniref:carbonic anhydrase n=1 Tax=unclassified Motilimonas TaxID=2643697 RepID=UPI001E346686|nr:MULTISPECIES: carbonic anhydrase family protein [unclassified Motilimonas]MCE0556444.1 carbonic anhydrase family protein [Motilimonas sp. E26]MDO6527073.1 carbonic anhydrase family protein [Motilimonas sp. 1_MG-2023]